LTCTLPRIYRLGASGYGEIDLDPASDDIAQKWIQAPNYYTPLQNGLFIPGLAASGCTHLLMARQPSGQKLVTEYESGRVKEAVLLVAPSVGSKWFQKLTRLFPVCFLTSELRFSMTKVDLSHDRSMAMPSSILVKTASNFSRFWSNWQC
jgi:hypothetical protein